MADTLEEMARQRTESAPSSAACWKAAMKAPGAGAAVSGRAPLPLVRSQNSSGESWRRSSNSSAPKRMVKGTTSTFSFEASSSLRSQALSVTIRTPGIGGVCHGPRGMSRTSYGMMRYGRTYDDGTGRGAGTGGQPEYEHGRRSP